MKFTNLHYFRKLLRSFEVVETKTEHERNKNQFTQINIHCLAAKAHKGTRTMREKTELNQSKNGVCVCCSRFECIFVASIG